MKSNTTYTPPPGTAVSRAMAHTLWAMTLTLIFMGALVKSHDAGLSVPDWPTTYGQNMFLFPPSQWRANIFYEHTHRLVASLVGFVTLALCGWALVRDRRTWVRACTAAALALVILQGVLGGLTVLLLLPASVSVAHGVLAQSFLLVTVFLAYAFSKRRAQRTDIEGDRATARWALALVAAVWIQLVIGAVVRHTESGLAIPDFPTMGGRWIPAFDSGMLAWINNWRFEHALGSGAQLPDVTAGQVAIHAVHRFFAIVVAAVCCGLVRTAWSGRIAHRAAAGAGVLVLAQIVLGIVTVLTERQPLFTSLHVVTGACLLAAAWFCALQALPMRRRMDAETGKLVAAANAACR